MTLYVVKFKIEDNWYYNGNKLAYNPVDTLDKAHFWYDLDSAKSIWLNRNNNLYTDISFYKVNVCLIEEVK